MMETVQELLVWKYNAEREICLQCQKSGTQCNGNCDIYKDGIRQIKSEFKQRRAQIGKLKRVRRKPSVRQAK